jgi:voltage-gated sodium channel
MNPIRKLFLDDRFVISLIAINAILIFIQAFPQPPYEKVLLTIDNAISVLFLFELINKMAFLGQHEFWKSHWNKFDFLLVMVSLPAIVVDLLPPESIAGSLGTLLILRVFRVFKFFRVIKFFPKVEQIFNSARSAVSSSGVVLAGFFVYIFIASLLCCFMFRDIAPNAFGNPLSAYYSIFQVFTIEGWYDIPAQIVNEAEAGGNALSTTAVFFLRIFFMGLLIIGGVFGLSIVNSLFIDAMLSGSSEDMEEDIDSIQKEFEQVNAKIDRLTKMIQDEPTQPNA